MEYLKDIISNKKNLIIIIAVIVIIIAGIILVFQYRTKQSSNCKPAGTAVEKTYKAQYLSVQEWGSYNDSEVKFLLEPETQKFISEKVEALRGYGGVIYAITDKTFSVDKGYKGNGCQPLRYYYDIVMQASLQGKDLSAVLFGRWYYSDIYKIKAVYNPESKKWESFDINLDKPKLIPSEAIDSTLVNAKKSSNFQEIIKNGYTISDLYWEPKNEKVKNDIVTLIYSKPVKNENNCFDYFTIKVDNFANAIVFENQEKKCQ